VAQAGSGAPQIEQCPGVRIGSSSSSFLPGVISGTSDDVDAITGSVTVGCVTF